MYGCVLTLYSLIVYNPTSIGMDVNRNIDQVHVIAGIAYDMIRYINMTNAVRIWHVWLCFYTVFSECIQSYKYKHERE